MKAVCIYFYLGRNICDFNKIFNRVYQLEFSVCFEPFTYAIYIYIRHISNLVLFRTVALRAIWRMF